MTATQIDRPDDQAIAETLDFINSLAGLLVDCWPALGDEAPVRSSTGALCSLISALHWGDRATALAAAETCRQAVRATQHHLVDPPFSLSV